MLRSIDLHSGLQATNGRGLSQIDDLHLVGVAQNVLLSLLIVVKDIVLHGVISSFNFIRMLHFIFHFVFHFIFHFVFLLRLGIFQSLADQSINNGLLLLGEGVKHVLNSLFLGFGFHVGLTATLLLFLGIGLAASAATILLFFLIHCSFPLALISVF